MKKQTCETWTAGRILGDRKLEQFQSTRQVDLTQDVDMDVNRFDSNRINLMTRAKYLVSTEENIDEVKDDHKNPLRSWGLVDKQPNWWVNKAQSERNFAEQYEKEALLNARFIVRSTRSALKSSRFMLKDAFRPRTERWNKQMTLEDSWPIRPDKSRIMRALVKLSIHDVALKKSNQFLHYYNSLKQ